MRRWNTYIATAKTVYAAGGRSLSARCRERRRRAMTLLEVILAISIVVLMAGGILAFHSSVLAARDRVMFESRRISAVRTTMGRLTRELGSARVCPFANIGLKGSSDRVEFITTVLPGPAAWAVRANTEEPIPPECDLELVGYRLRTIEDDSGQVASPDGLERTCQKNLLAGAAEEGEQIEVAFLTRSVKFLYLRYWDGNDWADAWGGGDLPGAVEITLGFEPLDEGVKPADYPYQIFRRVVRVETASKAPSGTVIRGLGRSRGGGRGR